MISPSSFCFYLSEEIYIIVHFSERKYVIYFLSTKLKPFNFNILLLSISGENYKIIVQTNGHNLDDDKMFKCLKKEIFNANVHFFAFTEYDAMTFKKLNYSINYLHYSRHKLLNYFLR